MQMSATQLVRCLPRADENDGPSMLPCPRPPLLMLARGPAGRNDGIVGLEYGVLGALPVPVRPNSLCTIYGRSCASAVPGSGG